MKTADLSQCTGCAACYGICASGAIRLVTKSSGFVYPEVDETICTNCGLCSLVCPVTCQKKEQKEQKEQSYDVYALTSQMTFRRESSSGGAFRIMAETVLASGGVVFGACQAKDGIIKHMCVDNAKDLIKLLGSKYVQSDTSDTYSAAQKYLSMGKAVLFCGTPCQAEALRRYLRLKQIPEEKLYITDLVCGGVMAPGFYAAYLDFVKGEGTLEDFRFRAKSHPNNAHTVSYMLNGEYVEEPFMDNPLCRIYTKQICLRESCYSCAFSTPYRNADITLGDFWNIDDIDSKMNDGYGVSLVLLHTLKGKSLLQKAITTFPETVCHKIEKAFTLQPRLVSPPKQTVIAKLFRKDVSVNGSARDCNMGMILKKYGM